MTNKDDRQLPLFLQNEHLGKKIPEALVADAKKESNFGKYIVYVDESGDHSLKSIDDQYPIFVLAFCVFHKQHYSESIVPALEKFKFNHFGHDQVVLHEHEIRKEKGEFTQFRSRKEKLHFLEELTGIIELSNFILISCTIDKRRLAEIGSTDENPYNIALSYCLESFTNF